MKQNQKNFNNYWLTLVELIVVITILVILWTIAFISLQWYSSQARDSKRLSDISNIKKSVELFSLNTWKYPKPDESLTVSYSWEILWYQWIVWDQVSTNLSRNLNEKPTDPSTWLEYTYSTTYSQTEYEVLGLYESEILWFLPHSNHPLYSGKGTRPLFFLNTNAATLDYPKIDGNYNWIYIKTSSFYVPTPSIINAEIISNDDLDSDLIKSQIISWGDNLPWVSTWWLDIRLSVYKWIITKDSTDLEKLALLHAIQSAYDWTQLANKAEYTDILSKTTAREKVSFVDVVILGNTENVNTKWCYYEDTIFIDTNGWTSSELKYDKITKKCYVFWDENVNAINACNNWVSENIDGSLWKWIWVPARYFVSDWVYESYWTWMTLKDSYYEKEVTYNWNDYVCRWFAVAKYEISFWLWEVVDNSWDWETYSYLDNWDQWNIISEVWNSPITEITQLEAMSECGEIGTHLITNNEWMSIARNIEHQWTNWSNERIWSWYVENGLDNKLSGNPGITIWCYDDDDIYIDPTWWETCFLERQLMLSNGYKITDLAWNVWEHVNKWNTIDWTNFNTNSFSTESMCSNNTWWKRKWWYGTDSFNYWTCMFISPYTKEWYWPKWNYNADNWMWRIYATNTEDRDNIFIRWGGNTNAAYAGIYSLYLDWFSSTKYASVGFRCVK